LRLAGVSQSVGWSVAIEPQLPVSRRDATPYLCVCHQRLLTDPNRQVQVQVQVRRNPTAHINTRIHTHTHTHARTYARAGLFVAMQTSQYKKSAGQQSLSDARRRVVAQPPGPLTLDQAAMVSHLGFGGDLFLDPRSPRTQQLVRRKRSEAAPAPVAAQPHR